MRSLALITILLAMPGTAFAGSFTTLPERDVDAGSILHFGGPAPQVAAKPKAPTLAPGHERIRVTQAADGTTRIHRTEAWLGGSPVTVVTTASEADLAQLKRRGIDVANTDAQSLTPDVLEASRDTTTPDIASVNRQETTGALDNGDAETVPVKPLDADALKLRPVLGNG